MALTAGGGVGHRTDIGNITPGQRGLQGENGYYGRSFQRFSWIPTLDRTRITCYTPERVHLIQGDNTMENTEIEPIEPMKMVISANGEIILATSDVDEFIEMLEILNPDDVGIGRCTFNWSLTK